MFTSKKLFGRSRSNQSRRNHRRLGRLESLEDRRMFNVDPHGGPVIPNVQVETVFYGHSWYSDAAMHQTAQQLDGYFSYLTGSSYMDLLSQYSTPSQHIGHGTLLGGELVDRNVSPLGGLYCDDSEIEQMLGSEIDHGQVPAPNGNLLYFVFTDPNTEVTHGGKNSIKNFLGYHSSFVDPNDGRTVYYAVIPNPVGNADAPGLSGFQQQTEVSSHELAEAVTDPEYPSGWYDPQFGADGEIGDLANLDVVYLDNYAVQMEWSNQAGGIAAPAGYTLTPSTVTINTPPAQPMKMTGGYSINLAPGDYTIDQGLVTFVDPNGNGPLDDYQATITWGDGQSSAGSVSVDTQSGQFVVGGDHTYAGPGNYEIQVNVSRGNGPQSAEQTSLTLVAPPPPVVNPPVFNPPVVNPPVVNPPITNPPVTTPPVTTPPVTTPPVAQPMPTNLGTIAEQLTHSAEYYSDIAKWAYQQFMGRAADASGLAFWVGQMQGGMTDEQLEAKFLAAPEYIADHGGSDVNWVIGMYHDLLGRAPDNQGLAWWTNQIANGTPEYNIALGFAASGEREATVVSNDYLTFLGRSASAGEVNYWVDQFIHGGARNEDVIAGFVSAPEYYNDAQKGNGYRTTWLDSAFDDLYHRLPSDAELSQWLADMQGS